MEHLTHDGIVAAICLSAINLYHHFIHDYVQYGLDPPGWIIITITIAAYILYRLLTSLLRIERDAAAFILVVLLLTADTIYRCFFTSYQQGRNELIYFLALTAAYGTYRYAIWVFECYHEQQHLGLPPPRRTFLRCLWPPLIKRRYERALKQILKETEERTDFEKDRKE